MAQWVCIHPLFNQADWQGNEYTYTQVTVDNCVHTGIYKNTEIYRNSIFYTGIQVWQVTIVCICEVMYVEGVDSAFIQMGYTVLWRLKSRVWFVQWVKTCCMIKKSWLMGGNWSMTKLGTKWQNKFVPLITFIVAINNCPFTSLSSVSISWNEYITFQPIKLESSTAYFLMGDTVLDISPLAVTQTQPNFLQSKHKILLCFTKVLPFTETMWRQLKEYTGNERVLRPCHILLCEFRD